MAVTSDSREVTVNLRKMAQGITRVGNKATNQAVKAVAEQLEANTPVWDGKKSKGSRGDYILVHAKDHVVYSNADQSGEAAAGYEKDVAWRVHFVEFGTVSQKPQGFIQRTEKQMEDRVMEIMAEELKRGLGL